MIARAQHLMGRWVTIRMAVILAATAAAVARLGLLSTANTITISRTSYGVMFAVAALWLALTFHNERRLSWSGRLGAVYALALFTSLTLDARPVNVASLYLAIFALLAFAESVTWRDC